MNTIEKLLRDIEKEKNSNKTSYTIKGIKDLTSEDLDNIKAYATFYLKSDGYGYNGFLPWSEKVKEVLRKYGIMW